MKHKIRLLFCLIYLANKSVIATTIGSATAMSQQTATAVGASNTMLDGCIYAAGFNTSAANQTAMGWSSQFPVHVTANWQNATIALLRDFVFGDNCVLGSAAIFNCNGFAVVGPEKNGPFAISSALTINGGTLKLNSVTNITATITFQGTSVLDGGGNVINMNGGGNITVASGASLTITNATILGFTTSALTMGSTTSSLTLQNVNVEQGANTSFTQGLLNVSANVSLNGPFTFTYSSGQALTINSQATLTLNTGTTFSYASSANNLLTFADATAALAVNGATIAASTAGLVFTTGYILFENQCFLTSSGTNGITFGNGTGANDPLLEILSGTSVTVSSGVLTYDIVNSSNLIMVDSTSIIYMADGTTLNLALNLPNSTGIINFGNATLGSHLGAIITGSADAFGTITYTTF